jgi:hypothetical protein
MTPQNEQFGFMLASIPINSIAGGSAFNKAAFYMQYLIDLLLRCRIRFLQGLGLQGVSFTWSSTLFGHLEMPSEIYHV